MPAMTDTQAQEAARLAALLDAEQVRTVDADVMHSQAAALLRSQAARIAELDAQIKAVHERLRVTEQLAGDHLVQRDGLRAELARMREPLSEKRIYELWPGECWAFAAESVEFARAIEAAHGITNTGEQQ